MAVQDDHTVRYFIWFGFWMLLLGFSMYLFQNWLDKERNPNGEPKITANGDVQRIVLKRNRYGHYVTTGYINGKPVEFFIDTGASDISIPEHIADRFGLKKLYEVEMYTANGRAKAFGTTIESAQIGNIILKDLRASINPNVDDDTVLLGMSFLKQIEFSQRGDSLILEQYR